MLSVLTTNGQIRANGNSPVNPARLAFLAWLAADYQAQQRHYTRLRAWYNGEHDVPLTERQKQYLAVDPDFSFTVNYLCLPVDLCIERLTVKGFDGPPGIGGKDGLLAQWWTANRMDGIQKQVHRAAAVDGDTYILVEWSNERQMPVFWHEQAYDGVEGVKVHYVSNQRRVITFASKIWQETRIDPRGEIDTTRRLNIYTDNEIQRYIESGRGWLPYEADGVPAVESLPIGIVPIVPFRWSDDGGNWGRSELEPLIPIQQLINKSILDEAEVGDTTAFQRLIFTGVRAPSDDEELSMTAGGALYLPSVDAGVTVIAPGDIRQLSAQVDAHIARLAQVSHIPLQYFQSTGQIASAATQAADDSQLIAKVSSEAVSLGNAWEDVMRIALRLNAVYGDGPAVPDDVAIETQWSDFDRVDPLSVEERRASILATLVNAGVSLPGALERLGYPEEDRAVMLRGDFEGVQP